MLQNLSARWKALWNHDMYHGWTSDHNYFEGWYVKIVSADQKHAFAFIPGISKESKKEQHAFIQVMEGVRAKSQYIRFEAEEFQPSLTSFDTHLGHNRFNLDGISLDLPDISGQLSFQNLTPWPSKFLAPGIMGWYSFVPFMQCYHGVVSLHHTLTGSLKIAGQSVSFDGGVGYIEKDWGTSFPKSWIWMQSNHFSGTQSPCCFMASIAHIPWLGQYFIGFLCGFYFEGLLYIFTTYNRSKYAAKVDGNDIYLSFTSKHMRIEIKASKRKGAELISPMKGSMQGKLEESLQSEIELAFYKDDQLVYEGKGTSAGLEIAGPFELLVTD